MTFRQEQDSMGPVQVPAEAYYGSQTRRAVENFPISGFRLPPVFIRTLARIKGHAARVNRDQKHLEADLAAAIVQAAEEVAEGRLDDQFPVDVFQTGSGTSTNMNMNEVLAGRANEIRTGRRGGRRPVHPNDHVNLCQSSNDVIPTTIHVAARLALAEDLAPGLAHLAEALEQKAVAFGGFHKNNKSADSPHKYEEKGHKHYGKLSGPYEPNSINDRCRASYNYSSTNQ